MEIILQGEPRSTGSIYRSRVLGKFASTYMTHEGKSLKESYQWQAKSQYKGKLLEGDIKLQIKLYFGTKRKCDIDNFNKLSFDSLTGIVWKDDSQVQELTIKKGYDKSNPRIELTIQEL